MSNLIKREQVPVPVAYEPPSQAIWIDQYLDEKQGDFAEYLQIILKRKLLALSVLVAVMAATGYVTLSKEPLFRSTARIQIEPEPSVLPYREVFEGAALDIATQAEVIKSEALASRVVTRMNPDLDPARIASRAAGFKSGVTVAPVQGAQVLSVSYTSADPTFAATAVNALADEYVAYRIALKRDANANARDFLERELLSLGDKLKQGEERLVSYGREHGIPLAEQDSNITVQKAQDLHAEMTKIESELLSSHYRAIQHSTPESFPESLKSQGMKDLDRRLQGLQQKLATLTVQFGPRWPEVIATREEIAATEEQRGVEMQAAIGQAKLAHDLVLAHRQRVAAALEEQTLRVDQLGQALIQFNILKREVASDRTLYDGLLQRLKETDVSAALTAASAHIIDRGRIPSLPFSPNVPRSLTLGLLLGMVAGVGAAVLRDLLDRSISTAEDVERYLRLPFLGAIPAFHNSWVEMTGGLLVPPVLPAATGQRAIGDAIGGSGGYVSSPVEMYWESYRSLRTSLLLSSSERKPSSILVTSAEPAEGKSTTAVNLAIALAQTGARTLIVELDMRRPKLAGLFGLTDTHGMSRYLSGHSPLNTEIRETRIPNLCIVPAGPMSPNPPELVGSARMQRALQLLGEYFHFVVIDAPPLMAVTDAVILSPQVTGVVLVVRAGKTATGVVQKARNLLRTVDANILGVVVNGARLEPSSQYGGYYLRH
jgi:capsular exopolysaccharide synthesis family protein